MTGLPPHPTGNTGATYPDADWYALIDYVTGESSPAERAALERRLADDPAFAAFAAPIFRIWEMPRTEVRWDKAAQWAIIQQKTAARLANNSIASASSPTKQRTGRPLPFHWPHHRAGTWTAVAVTLLVAFVVGRAAIRHRGRYYYQAIAQDTTVTLPDGSIATLSRGSYLGTESGFPTKSRELYLFGEAHFTVAANPRVPFIVHTIGVGTRVLGTTFRIHTDTTPHIRVSVEQGRVTLEARDATGHWRQLDILTAGQATHVTIIQAWLTQAGYDVQAAGVPFAEAMRIGTALRRSALQTGAAAVGHQSGP